MNKNTIRIRVKHYQHLFWLDNWAIGVLFEVPKGYNPKDYFKITATTVSEPQYKQADIIFNTRRLHKINDAVIIHEFVHILHSPFREPALKLINHRKRNCLYDLEEAFTTDLERILAKLCGKSWEN